MSYFLDRFAATAILRPLWRVLPPDAYIYPSLAKHINRVHFCECSEKDMTIGQGRDSLVTSCVATISCDATSCHGRPTARRRRNYKLCAPKRRTLRLIPSKSPSAQPCLQSIIQLDHLMAEEFFESEFESVVVVFKWKFFQLRD